MTDRPMPYSPPMIEALLAERKTQTRRILKNQATWDSVGAAILKRFPQQKSGVTYAVGDRLWVREAYYQFGDWQPIRGELTDGGQQKWEFCGDSRHVLFDAPKDFHPGRSTSNGGWPGWYKRLGRFMPRRLSRMTQIVTDVRVQRLQDISEADAVEEGIIEYEPTMEDPSEFSYCEMGDIWGSAKSAYSALWNHLNGPGAWEANPWIVAISFITELRNIDA